MSLLVQVDAGMEHHGPCVPALVVVGHEPCLLEAVGQEEVPTVDGALDIFDTGPLAWPGVEWTLELHVLMEFALGCSIIVPLVKGPNGNFLAMTTVQY